VAGQHANDGAVIDDLSRLGLAKEQGDPGGRGWLDEQPIFPGTLGSGLVKVLLKSVPLCGTT